MWPLRFSCLPVSLQKKQSQDSPCLKFTLILIYYTTVQLSTVSTLTADPKTEMNGEFLNNKTGLYDT